MFQSAPIFVGCIVSLALLVAGGYTIQDILRSSAGMPTKRI